MGSLVIPLALRTFADLDIRMLLLGMSLTAISIKLSLEFAEKGNL